MKISNVFGDNVQTMVLEHLLDNPTKVFTQAGLARELGCSPSSISRVMESLVKERLVMVETVGEYMKVISLKPDEMRTKALMRFHSELSSL